MIQAGVSIGEHFIVRTEFAQATPLDHVRVQEQDRSVVRACLIHNPAIVDLVCVVEVTFVSTDGVALVSRVKAVDRTALCDVVRNGGTQRCWHNHVRDFRVKTLFSNSNQLLVQHWAESLQGLTSSKREVTQTSVSQRAVERRIGRHGSSCIVAVRGSHVQHGSTAGRVTRASASECEQGTKAATVVRRRLSSRCLTSVLHRSTIGTQHLQFNVKHDLGQLLDFLICLWITTSLFNSTSSASGADHSGENLAVVAQVRTSVRGGCTSGNSSAFQSSVQSWGTEVVIRPNVQGRIDLAFFGHSHVGDWGTVFNVVRDCEIEVFDDDVGGIRAIAVTKVC